MKKGDLLEYSIWLTGTETPEQIANYKDEILEGVKRATEYQAEVEIGPWELTFKRPGEERVPQVPDGVSGPDVRLMLAVAKVGNRKPRVVPVAAPGFSQDLTPKDLKVMRQLTRAAYKRTHPFEDLSDRNCDQIIDSLGPKVVMKQLREAQAKKSVFS